MTYNAYDELMSYFQFEYNVYIGLVAIIVIGVLKSLVQYQQVRRFESVQHHIKDPKLYDLLISLIAVIAMGNAMFFQGVIADISRPSGLIWLNHFFYLFIASVVLFAIQVMFVILIEKNGSSKKVG